MICKNSLKSLHLAWLQENNLPQYLYEDFFALLSNDQIPYLERSVKINLNDLTISNSTRYSINVNNPTTILTQNSLELFQSYKKHLSSILSNEFLNFFSPQCDYSLYVGLDKNIPKIGMDYTEKYIIGAALLDEAVSVRRYDIFLNTFWYSQLIEYIILFKNALHESAFSIIIETINKKAKSSSPTIYIKQDANGIVWHFNCKTYEYPLFDYILNKNFNEYFTWFSFDSDLKYLTLYMRPLFNKS
jgi:hypothetical protein